MVRGARWATPSNKATPPEGSPSLKVLPMTFLARDMTPSLSLDQVCSSETAVESARLTSRFCPVRLPCRICGTPLPGITTRLASLYLALSSSLVAFAI
ncbi:hypothetical protein PCANC_22621 [Puccinia coronata f. sp. avenae]|uniref:Uncharacterized protein n=1 Tax=Puccinia coronata f. sp. avenae TaxID=200324 RepID=A0A2N5S2N6_9BASI|nr:hypothetical protein PCASD_23612 [Puccinia coronata f. sp. avenae]PLW08530.1 hypothetical protein PCANC_22621 [Puccinia coronata f. sp. avenae]